MSSEESLKKLKTVVADATIFFLIVKQVFASL
jgi:hypothetical protein